MKKSIGFLLVFLVAACSASPASEPSAADTALAPPATASITLTPSPTPAELPTARPTILPATFIAPTLQPGSPVQLSSIQVVDARFGWAIKLDFEMDRPSHTGSWLGPGQPEGYILRTSDGGKTWQNVTPPTGAYSPGGFFALDANTAWASDNAPCCNEVTHTSIWRTTDGGRTWQASQSFSIQSNDQFYLPFQMQFIDQNTGWLLTAVRMGMSAALGYILFQTTDGGETWTAINNSLGGCHSVGFAFIDPTTGWYGANCFSQGTISEPLERFFEAGGLELDKTVDGGHTFDFDNPTLLPVPDELRQPELAGMDSECAQTRIMPVAARGIGVDWECRIFTARRTYQYFSLSPDAGETWNTWESSGSEYFFSATHGWRLLSPGQLQQTTDGGLHWETIKVAVWEGVQFDFVSELEGWAVVTNAGVTALVHTTDGGETWEEIKPAIALQ